MAILPTAMTRATTKLVTIIWATGGVCREPSNNTLV
jgi:hypothetical protein